MVSTSIYIPYVHYTCTEDRIKHVFERDRLGNVNRVDFIKKNSNNGGYYVAFVHFNYWYDNIAADNLKNKIDSGEEGRVVYDDPYYWIIYKNINPVNPRDTEQKLECAMMMIEDLQNRVNNLEHTTWNQGRMLECVNYDLLPPPPRLRRQHAVDRGDFIISDNPFAAIHN